MSRLLAVAALLAAALSLAACEEGGTTIVQGGDTPSGITVQGTGRVQGTPDIVLLRLGVQATQPTVEAARNQAAAAMQAVIDSLKANGLRDQDIQTAAFTVLPQYDFTGRSQVLRGYQVSNTVNATLRQVEQAGKVIDDSTRAGGNDAIVQSIAFSMDDPRELQSQARERAVADARAKAEALARHAGVSLGRPLSISEVGGAEPPQPLASVQRTADAATPIQPGQLEIVVNIIATFRID